MHKAFKEAQANGNSPMLPPDSIYHAAMYADPVALRECFTLMDTNKDGVVTFSELKRVVDELNAARLRVENQGGSDAEDDQRFYHPELDARAIWSLLDLDKSGGICMNEFTELNRAAATGPAESDSTFLP